MNDRMLDEEYISESEDPRGQKVLEDEIDDLQRAPVEIDWINPNQCMPKVNEDLILKVQLNGECSNGHRDMFIVVSGYFCEKTRLFRIFDQTGVRSTVFPPNQVTGWRYIEVY